MIPVSEIPVSGNRVTRSTVSTMTENLRLRRKVRSLPKQGTNRYVGKKILPPVWLPGKKLADQDSAQQVLLADLLLLFCQRCAGVTSQTWVAPGDDTRHRNGGDTTADDGKGDAKERGDEAGFEFT